MFEHKNPIKYEIVDLNNEPILGTFYESDFMNQSLNAQVFILTQSLF